MARNVASLTSLYGPSAQPIFAPNAPVAPTNLGVQGSKPAQGATAAPIPVTQLFSGWKNSIMSQPALWLFLLVGVLVAYKLIEEQRGTAEKFQEIKIGLHSIVKIGLMAVI